MNEARKRTGLNRKVLIRKLAHPPTVRQGRKRRPRGATYGADVVTALVKVWEVFDYPCEPRTRKDRNRRADELIVDGRYADARALLEAAIHEMQR